jgi:hypothetical protein
MAPFGFVVEALESCIEKCYRIKSVIVGPTHVLGSLCRPVFFLLTGTLFFCVFTTAGPTTKYGYKA